MVLALTALMVLPSGGIGMRESYAAEAAAGATAEDTTGHTTKVGVKTTIHDIFYAKDDSKLEKFKERIYNGLLYRTEAINVADLDIRPEEIVSRLHSERFLGNGELPILSRITHFIPLRKR